MIANNLKKKVRQGTVFYELKDINAAEWNEMAMKQRERIFLKMFGFDPEDDAEAVRALGKIFQKISR